LNSLTRFSLKNSAVIIIAIILLFVGGIYAAKQLPLETMPNLDIPIITVVTVYPGAGPAEVLEDITKPLEKATKNVQGTKTLTSTSSDNVSVLVSEFEFGDDLDKAKRELEDAVKSARLPENAQPPKVSRISFDAMPIMRLAIADDKAGLSKTQNIVKDKIVPKLQDIDGVANVSLAAQENKDVRITLSPEKLGKYNVSAEQISQFLTATNIAVPAGNLSFKNAVLPVTVGKKFNSLKELRELPLLIMPTTRPGAAAAPAIGIPGTGSGRSAKPPTNAPNSGSQTTNQASSKRSAPAAAQTQKPSLIKLGDVATVARGADKQSVAARLNSRPAVSVNIIKDPDANTVAVADAINNQLASIRGHQSKSLKIRVIEDQSIKVRDSINDLLREGIMGALLAMLIILIFLNNWRSTLIAVVSIPLSILIALIVIEQMGISLNIMTLAGMAVAVGRIVDDSIVVIENIYRHRQIDELKGDELVKRGTKEVSTAIASSTFTLVGVFGPLALISGIIGQVFYPFAVAVVASMLASLLVALTIVPLLGKYLIANAQVKKGKEIMRVAGSYRAFLEWSLNHKLIVLIFPLVILGTSMALLPHIGSNFLPNETQNQLNISITMPPGSIFKSVDKKTRAVEKLLKDKAVKSRLSTIGGSAADISLFAANNKENQANIFVELTDKTDVNKYAEKVRRRIKKIAGSAKITVSEIGAMGGTGQQVEVIVEGDNLSKLRTASNRVENKMNHIKGLVNIDDNLAEVKDGVMVDVDATKAAMVGLSNAQVGMWLRGLLVGKKITRMTIGNEGADVKLLIKQTDFSDISDVAKMRVPSPLGLPVLLGDIATVTRHRVPVSITRRDSKQYASIKADVTTSDSGAVTQELRTTLKKMSLPSGIHTKLSGVSEEMKNGFNQLLMAMLISIGLVYLIMVLTFGQARAPLAIIYAIPFDIGGALIGLYIAGQQINVSSLIGGLMLIGIVVANAIVLIDLVQQKRAEGIDTRTALLDGGATRLRPILMTALATIFALLPLALGLSGGGLISQSLAIAVIGGLSVSAILTLIITPVVFEILANIGRSKNSVKAVNDSGN